MAQLDYVRDYNHIKNKLKNDYNVDVDENTLKEFEESVLKTGGNGVIISNVDFLRRYIENNCGWTLRGESKVIKFEDFQINEDGGVATATAGNVSGMGAVVSSQPSGVPGSTQGGSDVGSSFGADGKGTVGSGDIGARDMGSHFGYGKSNKKKDKKKKANKTKFANLIDGTSSHISTSKAPSVLSFTDFANKGGKKSKKGKK